METNLIHELKKQTGASEDLCHLLLEESEWDITSALVAYMKINDLSKGEERVEDPSRYNISGSWHATHSKGEDRVDGTSSFAPAFVQLTDVDRVSSLRPTLHKTPAVDLADCKKLTRGISRATDNENIVSQVRSECAQDVSSSRDSTSDQFYIETPEYTFTLPNITIYSEEFRKFLEKDLLENSTLVSLEQTGRLNWWSNTGATKLWPLATCGDGNCLPHAASLGLWGFHDRLLTLRKLLHNALLAAPWRHAIRRRWRWAQTRQHSQSGLVLSSSEWDEEWSSLVARAAPANHSLEEIHVFALAHTLRRPIIVIADVLLRDLNGEAMAPIPFGGVYLPLECSSEDCHKSPLLLAYDMGHFSALVVMESDNSEKTSPTFPPVIPLCDSEGCLLPIQFSVDPGDSFEWNGDENDQKIINRLVLSERDQINLLCEYLDVVHIPPSSSPGQEEPDLIDLSEEDITNRFSEVVNSDIDVTDHAIFDTKSKTAKQIQSVAKQFGSIGKSMSNKLKKNLSSITKNNKSNNFKKATANSSFTASKNRVLCCQLKAKRHSIQEKMVANYLQFAEHRFLNSEQVRERQDVERKHFEMLRLRQQALIEGYLKCINVGCEQYGTAITSYMCQDCFHKQKQHELSAVQNANKVRNNYNGMPRYDTGKSKFYAESDHESHDVIKRLPVTSLSSTDHTLYLSKSTFYNDTDVPSSFVGGGGARSVEDLEIRHPITETDIDWRQILGDDSPKRDGKPKRSTLPAKIHIATNEYRTGWDCTDKSACHPRNGGDACAQYDKPPLCKTANCPFFGSPLFDNLCSKCGSERVKSNQMLSREKL